MVDLDVRRQRTGEVELLDADEFAEHQLRHSYPAQVIESARQSASYLRRALSGGTEPFAGGCRRYLRQVQPPGVGSVPERG